MRISDWSSDVCSSDLDRRARGDDEDVIAHLAHRHPVGKGPAEHRRVEGMRAFLVGRRQLVPVALAHAVAAERGAVLVARAAHHVERSEEHTSELQSLMRISYAVFCLKKKKKEYTHSNNSQ